MGEGVSVSLGEFFANCGVSFKSRAERYLRLLRESSGEELAVALCIKSARVAAALENNGSSHSSVEEELVDVVILSYLLFNRVRSGE